MRKSKEYDAWQHMIQRCSNPKNPAYKNYGGRGIKVCERWLKFENFISDVGLAPSPAHTFDRYPNNDGNYEPGNFRWATFSEQNRNKRSVHQINGKSAQQWSIELGGDRSAVLKRLRRGWTTQDAITIPFKKITQTKMP